MILKETAIAALITELHHTEMYAFHLMASGIDMPETVIGFDCLGYGLGHQRSEERASALVSLCTLSGCVGP